MVQLNGHHLTGAIGQLPLETFKSVMFHVLGLVAPLVHDEGEDAEGDGVHWEGTDHCRTDPSEKKAMSLLFQAELQRKQLVKGCWLAKGACLKTMQGSPVLLRTTKVVRLKSRLDDVLWIREHPGKNSSHPSTKENSRRALTKLPDQQPSNSSCWVPVGANLTITS